MRMVNWKAVSSYSRQPTVGPEGWIRANVQAHGIVVHGRADGTLDGIKRVDLKKRLSL